MNKSFTLLSIIAHCCSNKCRKTEQTNKQPNATVLQSAHLHDQREDKINKQKECKTYILSLNRCTKDKKAQENDDGEQEGEKKRE